jgi:tetratricopeptide (TPR) repeat protein
LAKVSDPSSENTPEAAELDEARAQKKLARRLTGMAVFMFILAIPVFIAGWRLWNVRHGLKVEQRLAEAELQKARPNPVAYGSLGAIYLDQGRVAEALPLLEKASKIEAAAGSGTQDTLTLAKAHVVGAAMKVPGASRLAAEAALQTALALGDKLPQGRKAATYFSAGMFYRELGRKEAAQKALETAVALQPDDWVDEGNGVRYKQAGIAGHYQKMLARTPFD